VGDIQRFRPALGLLILTFPGVQDIARSVAKLIQYEFIIYRTGKYELQMYHRNKNFKNPENDWERLEFLSGDSESGVEFPPLPKVEQDWYDAWRSNSMLKHPVKSRNRFEPTKEKQAELPTKSEKPEDNKVAGMWGE
jgi:hypothetical protein